MRIEFIEEEPYCRFDGVLTTPEGCVELYGYDGEIDIYHDTFIVIDEYIYTDDTLSEIIKSLGMVHGSVEEYDVIVNEGRGYTAHKYEKELENTVVINLDTINHLIAIKPFNQFAIDYPNFNMEKYLDFMECLDQYYKTL